MLKTKVIKDKLVITISLEGLRCSLEAGRLDMLVGGEFKITNMKKFMPEYLLYMMTEQEDGSTPVHLMFDEVAADMLENTDDGCEVID